MDTQRLRRVASQIREKEDTDRSLQQARLRQKRMLPKPPELERYEIDVYCEAAAKVSGDFYDFIPIDEDEGIWGFVVGDVTGHGVEAGIIMGMAKQTVSIYGRQIEDPREVLCLANDELHRSLDARTFVSLSYGVLHTETGVFKFVRAGQCKPILLNPRWVTGEPQVVESKGLALGVTSGERFRKIVDPIELRLEPGDILFQYTDGLPEAMNKDKEQFGEERLMELLQRYARTSARELTEIVVESLNDFTRGAEQEDDITLMALKVRELPMRASRTARFEPPDFAEFVPKSPKGAEAKAAPAAPAPSAPASPAAPAAPTSPPPADEGDGGDDKGSQDATGGAGGEGPDWLK